MLSGLAPQIGPRSYPTGIVLASVSQAKASVSIIENVLPSALKLCSTPVVKGIGRIALLQQQATNFQLTQSGTQLAPTAPSSCHTEEQETGSATCAFYSSSQQQARCNDQWRP